MKMIGGLMGAPVAAEKKQFGPPAATQAIMSPKPEETSAAVLPNATRDAGTPSVQLSVPEGQALVKTEAKPDEKQSLLMKAVEGLAKTFGVDIGALTKLLLQANPKVAQEALTEAAQNLVAKQVAANPTPATV